MPLKQRVEQTNPFLESRASIWDCPPPWPRLSKAMLDYFDAGNNGGQSYLTPSLADLFVFVKDVGHLWMNFIPGFF